MIVVVIINNIPHHCQYSHSFLNQFFTMLNLIQNIIIIIICRNNWMSLSFFFCLVPDTNILMGVLYISYDYHIKTCIKDCACWEYDGMLQ